VSRFLNFVFRGITVVLGLLASYLFLTSLPTWLGVAGVLADPGTGAIADALARGFLGVILLAVALGLQWLQGRIGGE
jgi:hypothetical protein